MTEKTKNILIGFFVLTAIAILISMVLFLEPTVGDGKKRLRVRFANISGIVVGTRVTFAGKPVGEVISIEEVKDARAEPSDETGRVYLYQLTLKVDSSVEVFNTDEIAIKTTGLMGEKSIAILPKAAAAGKSVHLVDGEILYANSIDPLENTFNQISKVAFRMEEAIAHFDTWFAENSPILSHTLQSADGAATRFNAVFSSIDQTALIPALKESVDLFNENLRYIRESLGEEQLLHKVATLADHLDQATKSFNSDGASALHNLQQITRDLANGTGTIGRLVAGEDVYLHLTSLLNKAETLMNDINHYGLLFQYDKHWQRSRTKKANLLKALDSPKEFRSYFEGEVDSITTSLGRLTELLERSGEVGERDRIAQNSDFKRQFATLLRSVQSLSDSIKLYNEGLLAEAN